MSTSFQNQIEEEPKAEQGTLPGVPQPIRESDPERFLAVPGDLGRYLNIIFAGSTEAAQRTLQFTTTDPETGSKMVGRVRGFLADGRHLATQHMRATFGLGAIARRSAPDSQGYYHADMRDLARETGIKWHGRAGQHRRGKERRDRGLSTPRQLAELCRDLRMGGYFIENVFYDERTQEWVNRWDNPINILEHFSLEVRIPATDDGREARHGIRFKFSDHFHRVLTQDSLPVPHQAVRQIDGRNTLAPILLTYLSTVMADKTAWDRYTDALLVEDLRYTRNAGKPAEQKRTIERALRYINGAIIPTGTLSATIGPAVDGARNVLHVRKAPFQQALRFVPPSHREDRRRTPREPWQRRPTALEKVKVGEWAAQLLAFGGDEHSAVFYEMCARRFILTGNEQALFTAMASARELDSMGHIQTTRAQVLTRELLVQGDRYRVPLRRPKVAPTAPEQFPAPSAGARREGSAPHSEASTQGLDP
jgi:hypothetical protein